jgi:antitoxin component HigA of HigAB toxin-antitoxin module
MSKVDLNALNKREPKSSIIKRLLIEATAPSNISITVAEALEFRREQYGLTRTEFAAVLGLARSHYNEVVNGKRQLSIKAVKRAFAVGVSVDVLLQIY